MRTFEHFPDQGICPICGKNDDKLCVLVSLAGTQEDNIIEAIPTHLDCIDLTYYYNLFGEYSMIMQRFIKKEK